MPPFRLDVCCPDAGCGVYQETLNWLCSLGFEPALGRTDDCHYMDIELPAAVTNRRRIKFFWQLAHRCEGVVYCRCGLWHQSRHDGLLTRLICGGCGAEHRFCEECDALTRWRGCGCGKGTQTAGQ